MTRRTMGRRAFLGAFASLALAACAAPGAEAQVEPDSGDEAAPDAEATLEPSATYRGFTLENVLEDPDLGAIHYNLHVPDSYDGSHEVALFVTLPGYQGLYFQGVGENLRTEDFGFVAQDWDPDMIVCAPQLEDWGETSACQTVALVEHLLETYAIDPARVLLEGYSGGGETLSLVMGMRPELFCRALFCSSQWDGDLAALAASRVPVYLVVGEHDEYYGSDPAREAADELSALYRAAGLPEDEIGRLVTLDVKDDAYFSAAGVTNQHGGGGALFCRDEQIMGWLFA